MATTEADAAASTELFGITAKDVRRLAGESDETFAITSTSAERYVLKVSGDEGAAALENRLLSHLHACGLSIAVPAVLRTQGGDDLVAFPDGSVARLLSWVPGTMLSDLPWHSAELLADVGRTAAHVGRALAQLDDAELHRSHDWDLRRIPEVVSACLPSVAGERRALLETHLELWDAAVSPVLDRLPQAPCHHDLNDFNLLASVDEGGSYRLCGVVDFGDALYGPRVAEVAIAVAYAMLRKDDPLDAAAHVVRGYHSVLALDDDEIAVLFPLAILRLVVNASIWTHRLHQDPSRRYGDTRSRHTWDALERLASVDQGEAEAFLRLHTGRDPWPGASRVRSWLAQATPVPMVEADGRAISPSGEAPAERSARRRSGAAEASTVRLGTLVAVAGGTPVHAPFDGTVHAVGTDSVTLSHPTEDGTAFFTTVRGVDPAVSGSADVSAGQVCAVSTGDVLIQLSTRSDDPPAFVRPSRFALWDALCPDPARYLFGRAPEDTLEVDDILAIRAHRVARSQRSYYQRPPNLVRSAGVWLTDADGRMYLDAVNNVTHVGHCHPKVVQAAYEQMLRLNTNSRFVYEGLARYADRLASTLPDPLDVVFFVCTGSEANDLALRMARTCTGRQDVMVIDGAYHGNTTAVTGISPNRYKGPGGLGAPPTTHEVPQPNRYRGEFGYDDPLAGHHYAEQAVGVIQQLVAAGRAPAAFIAESLIGTGGQVDLPPGFLPETFAAVREAGGLCISDEVQVGLGRLGTNFWGFETHGVVPDIVTMGKPMGNGHPMAAVVTTRAIADAFDNGMKYFNTFAGNPVSCAVGMAVLDVIEDEGLQARAVDVGRHLKDRLTDLGSSHALIGDVRGQGLYVGVELVKDRGSKEPATTEAYRISERFKDEGVITYPNGQFDNILKLKPPMVFDHEHVDIFVDTFDLILRQGW